jgi:hypothetical protein
MKSKDQNLLEEAYLVIRANIFYETSKLKQIYSLEEWNSFDLNIKLMFAEAYSIGCNSQILEEGILGNVGKAALKPFQIAGKIYSSIVTPINEFIEKYAYEKSGLKQIDERSFNLVASKFDQYINKFDPKASSFIKSLINESQTFVKNNPIKMSLLSVAMTTAMSFAGAPTLAIFAAACLLRGTIGLLKGEKPIKAFGKSILVGTIGKILGMVGKEIYNQLTGGASSSVSFANSGASGNLNLDNILQKARISVKTSMDGFENLEAAPQGGSIGDMIKNLKLGSPSEVDGKYMEMLAQYQNKPISVAQMIKLAWKDLGLSDQRIEKLINSSFKDKNLVPVDLNHTSRFVFAQDVLQNLEANDPKAYAAIFSSFDKVAANAGGGTYSNMLNAIAKESNINLALSSKSSIEDWEQAFAAIQTKSPDSFQQLTQLKPAIVSAFKEKLSQAQGWAAPDSSVYFLNKSANPKNLFQLIASHEAVHTGQGQSPDELIQAIKQIKQQAKDKFLQDEMSSIKSNPRLQDYLQKNGGAVLDKLDAKFENNFDYLTNPRELQTWLGMLKKDYYANTGVLLDNSSDQNDLNAFFRWFEETTSKGLRSDSGVYDLKKYEFLKKVMDTSDKTKQIFINQLKDVAANQNKTVSNIA